MACKYICDGCGRERTGLPTLGGYSHPPEWFQRGDDDGNQDACSRECIDTIAAKSGKTRCVLPI
jgi:hypothetical protein